MAQLNNLIVTGSSRFLNKINGACTDGTAGTTKYMRQDGTWQVPPNDQFTLAVSGTQQIALSKNGTAQNTITVPYATSAGSAAPTSHTHGNIQNGGTLQTNDITIAKDDKLVVTDSSDSAKVARTSVSFDGSTTTKCLTQKGTWESFTNNAGTITGSGTSGYIAKWNGGSSITNGPAFGTSTTTFLRNDGSWVAPTGAVASVAGKTGTVTLSASDVGALASTTKYAGSDSAGGAANTVKIKTPTFSSTGNTYSILLDNTNSDVSSSNRASIFGSGVWTTLNLGGSTTGSVKLFADNGGYHEIRPNSDLTAGTESIQYLPLANGRLLNTQSPVAGSDSYGGPATAANKLINNVTVGTSYNPVYFYQGLPVMCKYCFDSGNIASKGTAQVVGIQRGLIIISRGTAGAGVYFIDNWYGVATAVNNSNFTVTCSSKGTATLKNNHASLQATYFAIYYKQ